MTALGPVVTVGLGSLQIDAVAGGRRLAPLSAAQRRRSSIRRRWPVRSRDADIPDAKLLDAIIRIAQLMFENAEIASIDINPMIVSPTGCLVTDAHISVHPRDEGDESTLPMRRLA